MEVTIQSNLDAFNAAFAEYVKYTSKTPQEALEHKVKNVGLRLWQGFTAHQFGGNPRQKGVARREMLARTAAGTGTRIRANLMAIYERERAALMATARGIKRGMRLGTLDQWSALRPEQARNREQRVKLWQRIVGAEIGLRQSGIGALAAAFLWYRSRGKGENQHLVQNRMCQTIGSVVVGQGGAVITGKIAGINTVDERYGIVRQAITDETNDTITYVRQRQEAAAATLLR